LEVTIDKTEDIRSGKMGIDKEKKYYIISMYDNEMIGKFLFSDKYDEDKSMNEMIDESEAITFEIYKNVQRKFYELNNRIVSEEHFYESLATSDKESEELWDNLNNKELYTYIMPSKEWEDAK
tara:strand:+ start:1206 stop:1574 length:369 start_codon:yes stop_codon:yes gene_type:complete